MSQPFRDSRAKDCTAVWSEAEVN